MVAVVGRSGWRLTLNQAVRGDHLEQLALPRPCARDTPERWRSRSRDTRPRDREELEWRDGSKISAAARTGNAQALAGARGAHRHRCGPPSSPCTWRRPWPHENGARSRSQLAAVACQESTAAGLSRRGKHETKACGHKALSSGCPRACKTASHLRCVAGPSGPGQRRREQWKPRPACTKRARFKPPFFFPPGTCRLSGGLRLPPTCFCLLLHRSRPRGRRSSGA